MSDSPNQQLFQFRDTLWKKIESDVPKSEVEEIRRAIGVNYIEENNDLIREVEMLHEILVEFQHENAKLRQTLQNRKPRLPPAPARQFLEQQIYMLLEHFHSKANHDYSKLKRGVKNNIQRKKHVHDYIVRKHQRPDSPLSPGPPHLFGERPSTSASSASRRPFSARSGASSSRQSTVSAPDSVLRPMKDHISAFRIDEFVGHIRAALEEEKLDLLDDVEFLQSCLDMEHDDIVEEKKELEPPSMDEMREFSLQLEKEWLGEEEDERQQVLLGALPVPLGSPTPACLDDGWPAQEETKIAHRSPIPGRISGEDKKQRSKLPRQGKPHRPPHAPKRKTSCVQKFRKNVLDTRVPQDLLQMSD